jgi:uncharacterized membrane protein
MFFRIFGRTLFGILWVKSKGEKMHIKNLQKNIVILFISLILIFSFSSVCAEDYFADIQITVNDTGIVDIDGITNHPDLLVENSNLFTFKKQSYWLINITKKEVFSDYIYMLTLPNGAIVNHIKTSGFVGIEEESGKLIISGTGQNEELSIVVQYQIKSTLDEQSPFDFIILFTLVLLIIILTIFLVYLIFKNKQKESIKSDVEIADEVKYSLKGLTDRQKEIVQLLINVKRPLTQIDIQKELKIPKAAVSRNVHSLEIKGLIEIEKVGMSNLIRLKKP